MTSMSTASEALAGHFPLLQTEGSDSAAPWLNGLRHDALARFQESGLPTPRIEQWKYTNLRPLEKVDFKPVTESTPSVDRLPNLLPSGDQEYRLVFVNGRFRQDLSSIGNLPDGVEIGSLAAALTANPDSLQKHLGSTEAPWPQPLFDLNGALMQDGLLLRVKAGCAVELPIEVIYLGAPSSEPIAFHPRNLFVLEPGSAATVLEHHVGLGASGCYLANSASEIYVGDGAQLHHYKLQAESPEAFHLTTLRATLGKDAYYDGFGLSSGARLSRNEIQLRLAGEGAHCNLNGAYMMRGNQHCDNTTRIDHMVPNTSCREVFKGVLEDQARAVFQGKLVVHPDAQHTDGHQLSKALLLSDQAELDAKPELEIYADDVKCSHGATTGDLDHDALFYLRARGIPEAAARRMLIEAFLAEAVHEISAEGLCPALMSSVAGWLASTR